MNTIKPLVALAAFVLLAAPALAQETKDTRIGKLSFENGYPPSVGTARIEKQLRNRRCRACETRTLGNINAG
jgi:hypothetical protein